jgi:hypothetical protein
MSIGEPPFVLLSNVTANRRGRQRSWACVLVVVASLLGCSATAAAEQFHGKLMIVYFGYTLCPDVCPPT